MKLLLSLCGVFFLLSAVPAAELPVPEIPQGVGVNIHFNRGHETDLDLIAAAGIRWVRMDLGWAGIERQKGQYDWSAYDELTANLEKRKLSAIYILDYSNPLYEETVVSRDPISGRERKDTASPQHPESVAAFARWAAAAAARYQGRPVIWEIWNEPNISFWKPKPDIGQYLTLVRATGEAIRQADPHALLIAPATSEVPLKFLEDFCAGGGTTHLSALSVHPYRDYRKPPETAGEDYARLRSLLQRYPRRSASRPWPILSGEWGYASHAKGVSLETQANYLVRQQLFNLLEGIPISIWYDWKNDGPDPAEREHNFGMVTADLKPKPAYLALQVMTRQLQGYRIARRLRTTEAGDYLLLFKRRGAPDKLAAWTAGASHPVILRTRSRSSRRITIVRPSGESTTLETADRRLRLELSPAPQYVHLPGVRLVE